MNFQICKTHNIYITLLTFSVIFLVKCDSLFAQKDLTEDAKIYEYWAKRGIMEVVYAYMNDYIATVTDSSLPKEKIKDCTKEKLGLKEYEKRFIKPLETIGIEELSTKFDEVSGFLKNNNWSGAEKNVLRPLIDNLNAEKTLNIDFFKILKPSGNEESTVIPGYSNKMFNWNNTVSRIISNYEEDIKLKKNGKDRKSGSSMSTISPVSHKDSNLNTHDCHNFKFVLLIGFFSFLIGMFITLFIIKSKIYNLLGDNKEIYKNSVQKGFFSFLSMVSLLKKRKDEYKNKAAKFEEQIKQLEKELKSKNNTDSKINIDDTETKQSIVYADNLPKPIERDISKEAGNKSIFYFSIPEIDGRFICEKGVQINDGSKYYKIICQNDSDKGDLFYISGPDDKRAINRLDSYLKPVCDIENINNAENATRIEVLQNGKVIKISNSWVIDPNQKVKIKLV